MTHSMPSARRLALPVAFLAAATLVGCSSGGDAAPGSAEPGASGSGASEAFDEELHALLPQSVQDSGVLRLGSPTTNAPYITQPGDGVVGIFPELAAHVGEVLGVEIEFVDTPFPGLVPALEAGRIDAIWTVMNDTVEREQSFDMISFIRTDSTFLVADGNPEGISGIEDLCGLRAGTLRGAVQATLLEEQSATCEEDGEPAINISLYDDAGAAQTQLRSGNLDAFFGGTVPLRYLSEQVDNGTAYDVADETYLGGVFAIAIPKGEEDFANALIGGLQAIEESGEYGAVLEEYGATDSALENDEFMVNAIGAGELE